MPHPAKFLELRRHRDFGLEERREESGEREGKRRKKRREKGEKRREKYTKRDANHVYWIRENNNQKHGKERRPKCGISNEETVNHMKRVTNSPKKIKGLTASRKKADIHVEVVIAVLGHADTTV